MVLRQAVRSLARPAAAFLKPAREAVFTALASRDQARVAGWLAALMLRTVYVSRPAKAETSLQGKARRRILLLPRTGLNDDVLHTLQDIDSIEVVTLPRRVLKAIAAAFLPSEVDDNNYVSVSPAAQAAMVRYRAFLTRFWQALDPHRRIDAVVSGNFGYYAERELAAALEALGVPFVALHKENSWSLGSQAFWAQVYRERRGPFLGRRILVYSPIERDLQLGAGIVDPDRIEVVGMPRLDAVHRWRESNLGQTPKPVVLFASFPTDVSMPVLKAAPAPDGTGGQRRVVAIEEEAEHFNVAKLCHGAHRAVFELAASCPDLTVLVKTKGRARDREAISELFGVRHERELPGNLRIVHGGSPLPLIFRAAVVGGLHSTLLLEALAAGRPVVVPWFAEVLDPVISRYVFDLGPAVVRASSPKDFTERLKEFALARTAVPDVLPPATVKVLREWLGNEDGRAGERAAAAILRVIETNNSASASQFAS
jgi:hypothetical protein